MFEKLTNQTNHVIEQSKNTQKSNIEQKSIIETQNQDIVKMNNKLK